MSIYQSASACWRKKAYDSKGIARKSMKALRTKVPKHLKSALTTYKCKFCGFWHVGNNVKKAQRAIARIRKH